MGRRRVESQEVLVRIAAGFDGLILVWQAIEAVSTLQSVSARQERLVPLATALEARPGNDTKEIAQMATRSSFRCRERAADLGHRSQPATPVAARSTQRARWRHQDRLTALRRDTRCTTEQPARAAVGQPPNLMLLHQLAYTSR
jgi:hypothetical protein